MERDENVKKILLLDSDSILYLVWYGVKDSRNEELGKAALNDYIFKILNETKASHYIGFAQTKTDNFRYDIYPDYKANRKNKPIDESYVWWKPILLEVMYKQWGFVNPTEHHIESDDCMQIAFTQLSSIYDAEKEIIIGAIDHDLNAIHSEFADAHVWFDYKNRAWYRVRKERSILFFWKALIAGDPGDGIKGIPRKGKVFAEKLLDPLQGNPRAMFFATYREYIKHFGLANARQEYTVVRDCIQLLDEKEGFELPELREVPNQMDKIKADILNI